MAFKSIIGFVLAAQVLAAQAPHDGELFAALKKADSILFECGFNRCDLKQIESMIDDNLEFLHDQGGIQDRAAFFRAIRENICSGQGAKPVRKLVVGSLEVYPLYDNGKLYGAIQTGTHDFYREADGQSTFTATAKFIHTWLLDGATWKLHHVLSYDHQNAKRKETN
jgi:hypothetical protein